MEQTTQQVYTVSGVSSTTSTAVHPISSGPSSYQAMFGYRSYRGGGRGGLERYGYGLESTVTAVNVDESFAQMPSVLSTRSEEKQEMSVLNNRFATYIDKVRRLETQNKILQTKMIEIQSSHTSVSGSPDVYEDELNRLRRQIETLTHEKAEVEIQLHNCVQDYKALEKKVLCEIEARIEAEKTIKTLRKDIDNATLSRIDLERKYETLQEEIQLLKVANEEDVKALRSQVSTVYHHEDVSDGPVPSTTNLTDSLRDIRMAYDHLTQSSKIDIENVYKSTIVDLKLQLKISNQSLGDVRNEMLDTRRLLQGLTVEIEGLRSTNSSLENQVSELQDRHSKEMEDYQKRITYLEIELQKARDTTARHLVEYNKLMNLKLSLDLEIATYRKLLEGEEGRISKSSLSMDQSGYSNTSVTVHSTSVSSETTGRSPRILLKEEVTTKSSSSGSSSSSDSD